MPISLPDQLLTRLRGSRLEPGTLALIDAVGEILQDNKTPFFPAYTDHGSEHVERVIATCLRLVPDSVLDGDQLCSADAAIVIGSALLHDLAMHLREEGFVELAAPGTRFAPLPWFRERHDDRPCDLGWPELWAAFQREARGFGRSQLDALLGPHHRGVPAIAYAQVLDPATWCESDRLLIGEFLRRHHARLAHEIAIYGFPGGDRLLRSLPADVVDAMGCVARSHGEPIRAGLAYLSERYGTDMRPAGALLPFLMALLRIADFLQLEAERAPAILLHLKDPQSPKSIEEWEKHAAIRAIGWDDREDPAAVWLHVRPDLTLSTQLALESLVETLRNELDASAAVLDEHYGAVSGYREVRLSRRRVRTNLNSPAHLDALPFVPRRAALKNDTDLFRLMIWDLYGTDFPSIGGRELVQNAVDAVRERRRLEAHEGWVADETDLPDLGPDTDVLVTLEEEQDGSWLLRIRDRGIGMTPETVIDYFLVAGASYGSSAESDGLDAPEAVLKTGRFGIGAFATFLLGDRMTVTTRHAREARGILFDAGLTDDLIELRRCDAPVGTEIVVPVEIDEQDWDGDQNLLLSFVASYYRFADPVVRFEVRRDDGRVTEEHLEAQAVPHSSDDLDPRWRLLTVEGFDAVYWTSFEYGEFVHNGIWVYDFDREASAAQWHERRIDLNAVPFPALSIVDSRNQLDLALHRFWVRDSRVPFERELLTAMGLDLVAHGLVRGSVEHPSGLAALVHDTAGWIPALPDLVVRFSEGVIIVVGRPGRHVDDRLVLSIARAVRQRFGDTVSTLVTSSSNPDRVVVNMMSKQVRRPIDFELLADVSARPLPDAVLDILDEPDPPTYDPATAAVLQTVLDEHSEQLSGDVQLCAYRMVPAEASIAPSRLAEPWIQLLGGPLPHDQAARAALCDRVWDEHPEIRPMIDAWRASA